MSATAKTIDCASPSDARLLVTRNDTKQKLTLSLTRKINNRNTVIASGALDARGWHDLIQCAAFPPAVPEMRPPSAKGGAS